MFARIPTLSLAASVAATLFVLMFHCGDAMKSCTAGNLSVLYGTDGVLNIAVSGQQTVLSGDASRTVGLQWLQWELFSNSGNLRIRSSQAPIAMLPAGFSGVNSIVKVTPTSDGTGCNVLGQLGEGIETVLGFRIASNSTWLYWDVSLAAASVIMAPNGTLYYPQLQYNLGLPFPRDGIFGLGEQYNTLDLRGQRLPVITREQGVGRGIQPLTEELNSVGYVGGSEKTNYAARPLFLSSSGFAFIMDTSYYSEFHFLHNGTVEVSVNATQASGVMQVTSSMKEAVSAISRYVGRPPAPPTWSYAGVIVGMQGGTVNVLNNFTKLKSLGCPMSSFWLQDWTGVRQLSMRQGLWWNWKWNPVHYPNYEDMISTLRSAGIRTLVYVNPMLVNASSDVGVDTNLWQAGMEHSYFIRRGCHDEPWVGYNGASLVDFTNPQAYSWFKNVIKEALLTNVSGFMADFGEAVPLGSRLNDSTVDPAAYHNVYPDDWFRLVREAVEELGLGDEVFFFGRSAWLRSASHYSAGWQGDQVCSWDQFDGLGTAVTSLLSSGLSGTPFQHSDTGGYNAILSYYRTEELFYRWCEHSAFTTFFRTHEGSDPLRNWQFYRTNDSYLQFTIYAKMYEAWHFYRSELVEEAVATGMPVVRPLVLHYPSDVNTFNITLQYLVGKHLLVAPVWSQGATNRTLYLPAGCWRHVWNGGSADEVSTTGMNITVPAPVGCPVVFAECESIQAATIQRRLRAIAPSCIYRS